jgi:hypothetical protein
MAATEYPAVEFFITNLTCLNDKFKSILRCAACIVKYTYVMLNFSYSLL